MRLEPDHVFTRHPSSSNPPAVEAFLSKRKPAYDFGDYLRLQIDKQMYPFMDHLSDNIAGKDSSQAFADYSEWMADEKEARLYTESQHSGSIGPAKSLSKKEGHKLEGCVPRAAPHQHVRAVCEQCVCASIALLPFRSARESRWWPWTGGVLTTTPARAGTRRCSTSAAAAGALR